jgi:hypothetical protein
MTSGDGERLRFFFGVSVAVFLVLSRPLSVDVVES